MGQPTLDCPDLAPVVLAAASFALCGGLGFGLGLCHADRVVVPGVRAECICCGGVLDVARVIFCGLDKGTTMRPD